MRFPNITPSAEHTAAFHLPRLRRRWIGRARSRPLVRTSAITLAVVIAGLLASLAKAFIEDVRIRNGGVPAAPEVPLPVTPPGMPPFDYQHWR